MYDVLSTSLCKANIANTYIDIYYIIAIENNTKQRLDTLYITVCFLKATVFTTQGRTGRLGVVQYFVVPKTGYYELTLLGAAGGSAGSLRPCKGAKVVSKVTT